MNGDVLPEGEVKEKKMTVKELNQLYWIDKCIYQAEIQDPCGHSVCIVRKVDV